MTVIVNTRTGERGEYGDFVRAFARGWERGRPALDDLMDLLGADIRLIAPSVSVTTGREAARRAFERLFDVFPDLTGAVHGWAGRDEVLFIEMTFSATIGRRPARWRNVDRFRFENDSAVERVAFFDQGDLLPAFLSHPRGWGHLLRHFRAGI